MTVKPLYLSAMEKTIYSPTNRVWRRTYDQMGINPSFDMPKDNTSLIEFFEHAFSQYADREAYICMGQSLTFRQCDIYSQKLAAYLQSLGLNRGDKVAVMLPNILQYPICMMAIFRAGLVLVNVNPLYTSTELEHQLVDSEAKVLIIIENFAHTFEKVRNRGKVKHVIVASMGDMLGTFKGLLVNTVVRHVKKMVPTWNLPNHIKFTEVLRKFPAQAYRRPKEIILDDVAVLQYTGGTTGVAKGAMLTHGNLLANLQQSSTFLQQVFVDTKEQEFIAVALPLYHIFSFTACALMATWQGFTNVLIPNPRDLDSVVKVFEQYKPLFFPAVNTLFQALANHPKFAQLDHSNLKLAMGGGMSVLSNTAEAWEKITGKPIIEGYGLSETSPGLIFNPPNIGRYTGTIGIPIPGTDIVILDDDGNEVPLGENGEICAKGPQVMKGYWKHAKETANVMTEDGYFRTGDIGYMDHNGFVKIVDRKKDMILVSGFNVYPNEIEEVMTRHPKILECGVIGVPSEKSGEVPKIFIVRKDNSLSAREVRLFAEEHLTPYKHPKHIVFIDELPKSNVGKILRKELRKLNHL